MSRACAVAMAVSRRAATIVRSRRAALLTIFAFFASPNASFAFARVPEVSSGSSRDRRVASVWRSRPRPADIEECRSRLETLCPRATNVSWARLRGRHNSFAPRREFVIGAGHFRGFLHVGMRITRSNGTSSARKVIERSVDRST